MGTTVEAATDILTVVLLCVAIFLIWRSRRPSNQADISAAQIDSRLTQFDTLIRGEFGQNRTEASAAALALRAEVADLFRGSGDSLRALLSEMGNSQLERNTAFGVALSDARKDAKDSAQSLREEVLKAFASLSDTVRNNLSQIALSQQNQLDAFSKALQANGVQSAQSSKDLKEELQGALTRLGESHAAQFKTMALQQSERLEAVAKNLAELTTKNEARFEELRKGVQEQLEKLRVENEAKLEQMRLTVDEKLQGTLEARLGESFKLVSDRLDIVHKGLGEMQTLATGVGDLKRVLTNVKSRGGWGEVQLGMLLEDLLTKDQFETNVRIRPDGNEVVEFAIRLPGKGDGKPIYLPIDSKFPHEDYDRLVQAQESGIAEEVEKCALALERAVRTQAKTIAEKYICHPHSTEFAIMYLPTEGLFAEVIRRPGLVTDLQSKHRVMITGPTTLTAVLSSLQMGFRTLAIEQRSSEVWQVLGAAKAEFKKYGDVWDKLGKQLDTARKTVDDAGKRTRAVERKLRDVEVLDMNIPASEALLSSLAEPDDVEVVDEEAQDA